MASHRPVRTLAVATVAAGLLAVAACGTAAPSATPSGAAPSGEASVTPTVSVTTTTAPPDSPYPHNGELYGETLLDAVSAADSARIVDLGGAEVLASVSTSGLAGRPGPWTFTHCVDSDATDVCYYFNPAGNFAAVGLEQAGLGGPGAAVSVTVDNHSFPTDAQQYVAEFLAFWIDESEVGTNAYATDEVVELLFGASVPLASHADAPMPCGDGRLCVDAGDYPLYHFVVRTDRLGQADAIVEMTD